MVNKIKTTLAAGALTLGLGGCATTNMEQRIATLEAEQAEHVEFEKALIDGYVQDPASITGLANLTQAYKALGEHGTAEQQQKFGAARLEKLSAAIGAKQASIEDVLTEIKASGAKATAIDTFDTKSNWIGLSVVYNTAFVAENRDFHGIFVTAAGEILHDYALEKEVRTGNEVALDVAFYKQGAAQNITPKDARKYVEARNCVEAGSYENDKLATLLELYNKADNGFKTEAADVDDFLADVTGALESKLRVQYGLMHFAGNGRISKELESGQVVELDSISGWIPDKSATSYTIKELKEKNPNALTALLAADGTGMKSEAHAIMALAAQSTADFSKYPSAAAQSQAALHYATAPLSSVVDKFEAGTAPYTEATANPAAQGRVTAFSLIANEEKKEE